MEDDGCCRYFLEPQETFHRRYEALRAIFVERQNVAEVAQRFGYRTAALKSMISRFRASWRSGKAPPFLFPRAAEDHPACGAAKTKTGRNWPTLPTVAS